jgi:putative transposase
VFLEAKLRDRAREWIEVMVNEELDASLGLGRYERGEERRGYRNGRRRRGFTTSRGRHEIAMPRAAYFAAGQDGKREWNSRLLPRYARRSEAVEEALIKAYRCGTNTRRVHRALEPLLEGAALSKSTVSRVVGRLEEHYGAWRERDLSGEDIAIVFLDGFHLKMRLGGRVESAPVLTALGVRSDGTRVLLALEVRTSESEAAWATLTEALAHRGVKEPVLAVIDGCAGLEAAVRDTWPGIDIQRCTRHKLENLKTHAPKRRWGEIQRDYRAIVCAKSEEGARQACQAFQRRWTRDCPAVVESLREAGESLLTFYRYPSAMWKMLRTTNGLERANGEFRRRVKTQGSLPNVAAGVTLLFGLYAAGLIPLRRLNGWKGLAAVVQAKRRAATGTTKPIDKVR